MPTNRNVLGMLRPGLRQALDTEVHSLRWRRSPLPLLSLSLKINHLQLRAGGPPVVAYRMTSGTRTR